MTVFYEYRLYTGNKVAGDWEYLKGAKLIPPSGEPTIINWHEQHYENGKTKNDATDGRFKRIVRILKRLRDDMAKEGSPDERGAAGSIASFLIESLVYNVPNSNFPLVGGSYYEDVKAVIRSARNATADDARAKELWEVNGLKRLFAAGQTWNRQQANAFLTHAWRYVNFPE